MRIARFATTAYYPTIFRGITLTGFWLMKALPEMSFDDITALYGQLAARIGDGSLHVDIEKTTPSKTSRRRSLMPNVAAVVARF